MIVPNGIAGAVPPWWRDPSGQEPDEAEAGHPGGGWMAGLDVRDNKMC